MISVALSRKNVILIISICALFYFQNATFSHAFNLKKMIESINEVKPSASQQPNNNAKLITKDYYFNVLTKQMDKMAESATAMNPSEVMAIQVQHQKNGKVLDLKMYLTESILEVLEANYGASFKGGVGTTWWARLRSDIAGIQKNINQFQFSKYIVNSNLPSNYNAKNKVSPETAYQQLQKALEEFNSLHSSTPKNIVNAAINFCNDYNAIQENNYKNVSEKIKGVFAEREKKQKEIEKLRAEKEKANKEKKDKMEKERKAAEAEKNRKKELEAEKERQARIQQLKEQKDIELAAANVTRDNNKKYMDEINEKIPKLKEKAAEKNAETLVFKGFYLGMPIKDAELLMNSYYGEKYYTFQQEDEIIVLKSNEGARRILADKHGNVTHINLPRTLYNKMFNSEGMETENFLKTFIDAYQIPKLEIAREELKAVNGQTYGFQEYYIFRSTEEGYEFRYYGPITWLDQDAQYAAAFGLIATPLVEEGDIIVSKIHRVKKQELTFD